MNRRSEGWLFRAGLAVLAGLLLTGCSLGRGTEESQTQEEKPETFPGFVEERENVVVTYLTTGESILDDLEEVEQAVNEIAVPEIGVEVELRQVDALEAFSQYPLWISNQEAVDLMMLNYQDITQYISKGMLRSLDDLLEDCAPDICRIMGSGYDLAEGARTGRFFYGVAAALAYRGSGQGIVMPKEYAETTGFSYDPQHIYSMEELTDWLAALKELYPDRYPLGLLTAGNTFSVQSYFMDTEEPLGGESTSRTYLDVPERTVYSEYVTENYREFLTYLHRWYEAGYLYPDGALTDYSLEDLAANGFICAYPSFSTLDKVENGYFRQEMVVLRTTAVTSSRQNSKSGFWVVPVTSRHAEASVRFLNLMYADERVVNLIQWGIEGKHYEVTDREHKLISWPDGQGHPNGYYNPLGLYGDQRMAYRMCSLETRERLDDYEQEAVQRESAAEGFVYSSEAVSRELDGIQKVINKYVPVLESGSVDLEKYYPEFLEELDRAGLQTVIADKQRQLDAWLESGK